MPTDMKGKYEEVWVVYVYLKPACSVMDPETHWDKFETEVDALKYLDEWKSNPRFLRADDIRKYKVYKLDRIK